jgi:hypothetical protein
MAVATTTTGRCPYRAATAALDHTLAREREREYIFYHFTPTLSQKVCVVLTAALTRAVILTRAATTSWLLLLVVTLKP